MQRLHRGLWRGSLASVLVAGLAFSAPVVRAAPEADAPATPKAVCGPGSRPETGRQGRVTAADIEEGVTAKGLTCNAEILGRYGDSGGYKVHRFVDAAGHECAFYDTTLLWPGAVSDQLQSGDGPGAFVLDMKNPAKPVRTATLSTPAMQSPHESVVLNEARGLLIAVMGNPLAAPGVVDIYDVATDCRQPALLSSTPIGIIGHESAFAPDGMTFYASAFGTLTAIDVSDPALPSILWVGRVPGHGVSISDDGTRAYVAALSGVGPADDPGLIILDVSQIQFRVEPVPIVTVVSESTWDNVSIPQNALPITIDDHPYILEFDEFAGQGADALAEYDPAFVVGAARIIDIADERHPKVVSNIRLEVNQSASRSTDQVNDPGASSGLQGYSAHYCNVPTRVDPGILACSFILSGLRIFDIRDPARPREMAYANVPMQMEEGEPQEAYAMSSPTFAPERQEVWYSDGNHGFAAVRVTNGVWTGPTKSAAPPPPKTAAGTALAGVREIPTLRPATGAFANRARRLLQATGGQSTAYVCFL